MARTPVLERSLSLKILGAAFIAMLVFFVWLTNAFFTKAFVSSVPVTLTTSTTGLNLPQNADVKLRGMIVGEVRKVEPNGDGVKMTLAMNPKYIGDVPQGVTAQLIPKTLFGEKYVSLIPPSNDITGGASLKAGDVITKANVPIEVETLLNDLYPLLTAVDPVNLNYTLSALATALEGRGEKLGETLVTTSEYLRKTNPDLPVLIDDLKNFGTVADGYSAAIPDLARLLRNSVVTGNTVVSKNSQLTAFYQEGADLAKTLTTFTEANGENLVTLAKEGRPILEVSARYSSTFPCFLGALRQIIPKVDSTYRENMLHITIELIPQENQPNAYAKSENAQVPSRKTFETNPALTPTCLDLDDINKGIQKYGQDTKAGPYPGPDPEIFKLSGIKESHNGMFGKDSDYNRPAASSTGLVDLVSPSLDGVNSAHERDQLNVLLGASLGMKATDVPDLGSLLVGPMLRGTQVRIR
ncbi:MCE family protein [Aeromicrobium sp.]|uniref:MCE family protein n=1 Tax=Aeromicrobium sp. TaxID=1871063 RepID=UPI003C660865